MATTTARDANAALRALEPASRDANGFKARSALLAMRELAMRAKAASVDCSSGMNACWSGVRASLGSGKREAREDAATCAATFVDCGMGVAWAEERLTFAWTDSNWRFRLSAIEVLSGCCSRSDASEAFARRCFDRFVGALKDGVSDVRECAMDGLMRVFETFPDVARAALEAHRDDMRPQHVKEIEGRVSDGADTGTRANALASTPSSEDGDRAAPAAPVMGDGIVPPAPEKISNEKELSRAMDRIARDLLPTQDWLQRIAAMVRLEAIALGGGPEVFEEAFTESLGKLTDVIVAQIGDRRSAVVKQVSHLLVVLARTATSAFEKSVEQFVAALLKTTVVTIGIIAESGNTCIRGIIEHCEAPRIVHTLTETVLKERSPKMRGYIVEYLTLILKSWSLNERHIEAIGGALQKTLADADATVRSNSKACFEILSETSPAASEELLTKVHSKIARSLSGATSASESDSRASVSRREQEPVKDGKDTARAPKRWLSQTAAPRGQSSPVVEIFAAAKPVSVKSEMKPDVAEAVMFAERVERSAERASRAEASSKLRNALDDADVRTNGARAAKFEAEVTLHASRIAELLLGYISDANSLVIDPALESIATLVYMASDELKQSMPDLCLGVFEALTDYRESTRALASEALTAIGDVHKPDTLLPSLLRSLRLAETPRAKTGVLEFALYVLSGRGGGANDVAYAPAKVSMDLEAWTDLVVELACDVDEAMAKAAGANLAAIHAQVDAAVIPRRLLQSSEYKRVRFMEALERRVPKFASVLAPLVESQPSPAKVKTPIARTHSQTRSDSLDSEQRYEDQNIATLNRSYETMSIESPTMEKRHVAGFGERVVAALESMRDDNVDTVVRALRTVTVMVGEHREELRPYLKLLVPATCSAMDDTNDLVAAHAFAALNAIFRSRRVDAAEAFECLNPLIAANSTSDAPLLCVELIMEHSGVDTDGFELIVPALVRACESKSPAVRRRALRVLGFSQRVFGADWTSLFTGSLSAEHRAMVAHYARSSK